MTDETKMTGWELLLAGVLFVVLVVSRLYVVPKVWLWWLVPLGVPAIGWRAVMGLTCLVSLWRPSLDPVRAPKGRALLIWTVGELAAVWAALGIASWVRP